MKLALLAAATALLLAGCGDGTNPYRGTTDERRISRSSDEGPRVYARPIPGGCLYLTDSGSRASMAFAPFDCPPDAARWNQHPSQQETPS